MGILIECPKCRTRGSVSRKVCKCGHTVQKADSKNYWLEYYAGGRRTRERIGRSKQAAENRLREIQTAKAEGRHIRRNKNAVVTLGELRVWYLGVEEVKELSSYARLEVLTAHAVRILGPGTKVIDLSLAKVRSYRALRSKEYCIPHPDRHPSQTTINREVSALKTMLNCAVRHEKIESNPILHARLLKEDNVRERVLTDEEFERLLAAAEDHLKPVLLTAFYEPMRRAEILELRWDEVDLSTSPWFIRLSARRTKGKKQGRVIPLHPRVRDALQRLPSRFRKGRVFLRHGKPFNECKHSFDSAKRDAGIENFTFHDFRHCAVTNLRKAGNDYTTIMKASGHKTMSMFLRYNMVSEEDVAGMKWKGEMQWKDSARSILEALGLDPKKVLESLLHEDEENSLKQG